MDSQKIIRLEEENRQSRKEFRQSRMLGERPPSWTKLFSLFKLLVRFVIVGLVELGVKLVSF